VKADFLFDTERGGVFQAAYSTLDVSILSSIVSGNFANAAPDIANTATTTVNFSAIGSSDGFTLTGANNLPFGTNLKLAPLAFNGGSTKTHALLAGSPALNTGNNPSPAFAFDQRGAGLSRVIETNTDMGAYELQDIVTDLLVNGTTNPAAQHSRLTKVEVFFAFPVDAALFAVPGAVSFTRTGVTNNGVEPLGTIVDTSNGLIISPATGMVSSLVLTFQNINTAGIDYGSLSDGRWQLAVPSLGYLSPLNDPTLRRLFGDFNNDGSMDGTDFGNFGAVFGQHVVGNAFDFTSDGTVDGTDFAQFGSRFSVTL
jgi:hypothetical protein